MRACNTVAVSTLLLLCGNALGQTSPIYTVESNPIFFEEDLSTAPALAVGTSTVVVAGTHGLRLYNTCVRS